MQALRLRRIVDFLADSRMPHNMIRTAFETRRFSRLTNMETLPQAEKPYVAFTFDVEQEYGAHRVGEKSKLASTFLQQLADEYQPATVFVEGELVAENPGILRDLEKRGFEIGVHGYSHELWGPPQWYLSKKPLRPGQRAALLDSSVRTFLDSGLKRPLSFRAPNLVSDDTTTRLLMVKGFRVDSSLPSHKGVPPVPKFLGWPEGLVRIPVSADPSPVLSLKFAIPHFRFRVCNLKTLKEIRTGLAQFASRVFTLQHALGFPSHLVALYHSWEFFDPLIDDERYDYCSRDNFAFVKSVASELSSKFRVKYVSMITLADRLQKAVKRNDARAA